MNTKNVQQELAQAGITSHIDFATVTLPKLNMLSTEALENLETRAEKMRECPYTASMYPRIYELVVREQLPTIRALLARRSDRK